MESSSLEEENIIKDVRNICRLKKEKDDTTIKDIRNLFRLKKETKVIKDRTFRDINKALSVKEYLNKTIPYLKEIINNLKKSDSWKIQLTRAVNFVSFKTMMKSLQFIQKVIT